MCHGYPFARTSLLAFTVLFFFISPGGPPVSLFRQDMPSLSSCALLLLPPPDPFPLLSLRPLFPLLQALSLPTYQRKNITGMSRTPIK